MRGFDPAKVARFGERDVERLLADPGIVRNRLKVRGTVTNARLFLAIQKEFGSFDAYLWGFVGAGRGRTASRRAGPCPPRRHESDALSRDLKKRGFSFVGSTIMYAFMQAVGMVNDHTTACFRRSEIMEFQKARA